MAAGTCSPVDRRTNACFHAGYAFNSKSPVPLGISGCHAAKVQDTLDPEYYLGAYRYVAAHCDMGFVVNAAFHPQQVQDTLDPEYYLGAYRRPDGSWATTKFSDAALAEPLSEADMKASLLGKIAT